MVRAIGSYPIGHKFESHRRYQRQHTEFSFYIWPVGQAVKTPPFHGGNMGSSPVRVTKICKKTSYFYEVFIVFCAYLHNFAYSILGQYLVFGTVFRRLCSKKNGIYAIRINAINFIKKHEKMAKVPFYSAFWDRIWDSKSPLILEFCAFV